MAVAPSAATPRRAVARPGRPASRSPEASGNRTLRIGLELLQAMARHDVPASVSEVARLTGMSVTRASRYVGTLAAAGFLQQDTNTGKFELGRAALELGITALGRIDGVKLASELMRPLTEATGLVSILCVWGSNGPTAIRWEQGRLDLAIRIREGLHLSTVITAAGRIFLAYHDADELRPILRRDFAAWNKAAPPDQRMTRADVEALRREVTTHGLARAVGLRNPSLAALAAPIFGPQGRLLMSITLVGITNAFDGTYDGIPAQELRTSALKLSRMLGDVPNSST
jgi:DNA-binding IclR family transcriptional regulator